MSLKLDLLLASLTVSDTDGLRGALCRGRPRLFPDSAPWDVPLPSRHRSREAQDSGPMYPATVQTGSPAPAEPGPPSTRPRGPTLSKPGVQRVGAACGACLGRTRHCLQNPRDRAHLPGRCGRGPGAVAGVFYHGYLPQLPSSPHRWWRMWGFRATLAMGRILSPGGTPGQGECRSHRRLEPLLPPLVSTHPTLPGEAQHT